MVDNIQYGDKAKDYEAEQIMAEIEARKQAQKEHDDSNKNQRDDKKSHN